MVAFAARAIEFPVECRVPDPFKAIWRPYFFFHIAKAGGVSVIESAESAMGPGAIFGFEDLDEGRLQQRLNGIAAVRPPFLLLHGHASPRLMPDSVPLRRATLLRDPLDRLLSHFCFAFMTRHRGVYQSSYFRQPGLYGRREFYMDDLCNWTTTFGTDNLQVRVMSGQSRVMHGYTRAPVTREDIQRAISVLDTMDLVGITSELERFACRLGVETCGLPFPARHDNTSDRNVLIVTESEKLEIRGRFLQADYEVYQHAKELAMAEVEPRPAPLPNLQYYKSFRARLPRYTHTTLREYFITNRRALAKQVRYFWEEADLALRRAVGRPAQVSTGEPTKQRTLESTSPEADSRGTPRETEI